MRPFARTELIPLVLVNISNKMQLAPSILCVATIMISNLKGLVPTSLLHHIMRVDGCKIAMGMEKMQIITNVPKCALYALRNLSIVVKC